MLIEPLLAVQYLYISLDEMKAVANYIKSSGRVAISSLAARSNSLIDLSVKEVAPSADSEYLQTEQTAVA